MKLSSRSLGLGIVAVGGSLILTAAGLPAAMAHAPSQHDGSAFGKTAYQAKAKTHPSKYVKLDLLALNDFHGNLEAPSGSSGRINNTTAGGVAYLAAKLRHERHKSRAAGARPLTVAAGDLIGASPLLSAAFHDEPTIEAMNELGLQVSSVGNHEFDEGPAELLRMKRGGCLEDGDGANGANSCPDHPFKGANFRYLSANTFWKDSAAHKRDTVFPATKIFTVHKQKVAFIGMTLEGTPEIVSAAGTAGLEFRDEVETANALVPKLRERGVKSIIVLLHQGVTPTDATAYNDCSGVAGPALEIAENLSPAIDAVVSGHTHQPYNCVVKDPKGNPRLMTSASSFGRMVTKLHFLINPKTHDIVRPAAFAENMIVRNGDGFRAATDLLSLIDLYTGYVDTIRSQVIGQLADGETTVTRSQDDNGLDSPLGNLIADSQKVDETVKTTDGTMPVIALMNPGGIRSDLVAESTSAITYGAAFTVQPFGNQLVSLDLTGAQIKAILNQQWNDSNEDPTKRKILQVSGLTYTWSESAADATGADALVGDVLVDADGDSSTPEVPIVDTDTYRVVANSFLSGGGDGFTVFKEGTNQVSGGVDLDAMVKYLAVHDPYTITPTNRISSVD